MSLTEENIKQLADFLSKNEKKPKIHISELTKHFSLSKEEITKIILRIVNKNPKIAKFEVSSGWFIWLEEKSDKKKYQYLTGIFLISSIICTIVFLTELATTLKYALIFPMLWICVVLTIYFYVESHKYVFIPEKTSRGEKLRRAAVAASVGIGRANRM